MPDNTANFTYDGTNGPIGASTVTRAELITALEQLNYASGYNIRAIDELSASGLVSVDSLGSAAARSIAVSDGLQVTNATGVSGNPTISVGTPSTFRQAIDDTEANTVTNSVAVSILSTGTSYSVPAPSSGSISRKEIINGTASLITLTGAVWEDPGITTVRIPPRSSVTLISGVGGFWHVQHPAVASSRGALYTTSAAATVITDTTNYFADPSTTALNTTQSMVKEFDMPAPGQLRSTSKVPVHAHIAVSMSAVTASNNQVLEHTIGYYDDSAATTTWLAAAVLQQKSKAAGGDVLSTAFHADVVMDENDYLIVGTKNITTASNATITHKYMSVMGSKILTT